MIKKHFILDFQNKNYPYFEEVNEGILKQIPFTREPLSVLDVGAGRCVLAEAIGKLGYHVYAIEENEKIAAQNKERVYKIICADFQDNISIKVALKEKKFTYIIFSDVLEHVFDPLQVLKNYLPYLEKNGKILVSLPNAVNWLNRLRFLFGIFNYEMTGVMDRTHVRFFTMYSAKKLLEASHCTIEKIDCTPFIVRAFLPLIKKCFTRKNDSNIKDSRFYRFYMRYIYWLEYRITRIFPRFFAFRIILVAHQSD